MNRIKIVFYSISLFISDKFLPCFRRKYFEEISRNTHVYLFFDCYSQNGY